MMNSRDDDKKDGGKGGDSSKAMVGSSSRQWGGFKNPRIVRVSRTFGGKDRHSKVCTVKGLRDRRIRLSVPTAIQLYDLQDRLGLSQPSKVVDWLMDITKHDIDKLPPLPIIPGSFPQFHPNIYASNYSQSSSSTPFFDANLSSNHDHQASVDMEEDKFKYWDSRLNHKGCVEAQNLFPIASSSTSTSNPMFNINYWEPNSSHHLSLSQLGGLGLGNSHYSTYQPSGLSLSSHGSQLFSYPSSATTSSLFFQPDPNPLLNSHHQQMDNDLRQFNRSSHLLNSNSLHNNPSGLDLKPFHLHQDEDHERRQHRGD